MNNFEKIKALGINTLALWLEDNFIVQVPAESTAYNDHSA